MKICKVCGKEVSDGNILLLQGSSVCMSCAHSICGKYLGMDEKIEEQEKREKKKKKSFSILKPKQIYEKLNEYVVGQENAKKTLCVAAYNHYVRMSLRDDTIKKSNVLMVGPTGSGKTYLVQTLGKILDVPVVVTPATTLTESGYVGDDVDSLIQRLYIASGESVEKTERGIVFIDEIDKLCTKSDGMSRVVGGKGVQQALLAMLEGSNVEVSEQGKGIGIKGMTKNINTSNILFICGGAFPAMEETIQNRLHQDTHTGIGFGSCIQNDTIENPLLQVTQDDLQEFGMIPELLGRLPVLVSLEEITKDALIRILTEPKDSIIKQYCRLFDYTDIQLSFTESALEEIAKLALKKKTGARALRSVLEEILREGMFEFPSTKEIAEVIVTGEYIRKEGSLEVRCRNNVMLG